MFVASELTIPTLPATKIASAKMINFLETGDKEISTTFQITQYRQIFLKF